MSHQALQDLQWYTGIQHVHRIGMAECMWRDRDRERHTISGSGGNRFPNLGPDRSVRHFPDPRFLCPVCSFITPFQRYFQCCHHRLQLADVPGIGERNQPVSLLAGGHSSCRPGSFFRPLFQGRKLHKRILSGLTGCERAHRGFYGGREPNRRLPLSGHPGTAR